MDILKKQDDEARMREITGGVPSYHLRCTKESQAEVFDTLETGGNAVNAVYKYAYT